jgi:uncharacterized glyoxalase superfamily protein PhnB
MTLSIAPQFLVADLDRSVDYYCDCLGFVKRFGYQNFYVSVIRAGAEIHLKCADKPRGEREHRRRNDHVDAMIGGEDAARLFRELTERGAHIIQPLTLQPWGTLDFQVLDPDGYILCFYQDAPSTR